MVSDRLMFSVRPLHVRAILLLLHSFVLFFLQGMRPNMFGIFLNEMYVIKVSWYSS